MGISRDLAVGTVAIGSLLMASMLGAEVNPAENPTLYLHLAFTATFFTGLFEVALRFFRLGFSVTCNNCGIYGRSSYSSDTPAIKTNTWS